MWNDNNKNKWVTKSPDVESNLNIINRTNENECSVNIENITMMNDDLIIKKSIRKCMTDDKSSDYPLFHSQSTIQHVEITILEHSIEDFFETMTFRKISKGWNIAMMNYLTQNLHVACWCKLQTCLLTRPRECHSSHLQPYHAQAMLHNLEHLSKIEKFDPKTDLLLIPKTTCILRKAKERHYCMLPKHGDSDDRERLRGNIIERGIRFLLMMIKNPQSCLAKSSNPCSVFTSPMRFKGEMGAKNKEMFKRYKVEAPTDKENDCHKKTHAYFQLEQLRDNFFRNCEHWTLLIEHVRSMLGLHCGIEGIPMPSKIVVQFTLFHNVRAMRLFIFPQELRASISTSLRRATRV